MWCDVTVMGVRREFTFFTKLFFYTVVQIRLQILRIRKDVFFRQIAGVSNDKFSGRELFMPRQERYLPD